METYTNFARACDCVVGAYDCFVGAYGNTPLHDRPYDRPHRCHAPAGMDDWRCFMGTCNDCFAGVCDLFAGAYDCFVGAYCHTLHDHPYDRPHHCHAPAGMDDWRCFMGTCNDCFAGVCDLFAGAYDCFVGAYCHTPLHDRPYDRPHHCHAPGGMGGTNG